LCSYDIDLAFVFCVFLFTIIYSKGSLIYLWYKVFNLISFACIHDQWSNYVYVIQIWCCLHYLVFCKYNCIYTLCFWFDLLYHVDVNFKVYYCIVLLFIKLRHFSCTSANFLTGNLLIFFSIFRILMHK
jgi:hypothetical protein